MSVFTSRQSMLDITEGMFDPQGTEPRNPTGFTGAGELTVLVYALAAA